MLFSTFNIHCITSEVFQRLKRKFLKWWGSFILLESRSIIAFNIYKFWRLVNKWRSISAIIISATATTAIIPNRWKINITKPQELVLYESTCSSRLVISNFYILQDDFPKISTILQLLECFSKFYKEFSAQIFKNDQ